MRTFDDKDQDLLVLTTKVVANHLSNNKVEVKEIPALISHAHALFQAQPLQVTRPGRVQSRETLLDEVWGYSYAGYNRTVDSHIRRLRSKLGSQKDRIETVRGFGYRFKED